MECAYPTPLAKGEDHGWLLPARLNLGDGVSHPLEFYNIC